MMKNKYTYSWIFIIIIGVIALPLIINWLILRPRKFDIVGEGKDWLMFWSSFLSAIASFAMAFITWKTLKQNKEQLDELKNQWKEDHLPDISASLVKSDNCGYIRLFNISNVQINRLTIKIIHDPDTEVLNSIIKYDKLKQNLERTEFLIEPHGVRDFLLLYSYYIDGDYPGYIELKCQYNDRYEKHIKMYFSELSLVATKIERRELLDKLEILKDIRDKIKL